MDKERIEGCKAGLKNESVDFLCIPFAQEERRIFYKKNLRQIMEHTAVFAVSDFYAMELIHDLQEEGIRVPDDLSVIGFDDSIWCKKICPSLTTIRQDPTERAKKAVTILKKLKDGNLEETTVILPVFLVERNSVKKLST